MNFGFIKNRYTRGASYFVDLHRNLFGTNGWNWGTALKSHRLFYVNLQTSWTLDHCKPRLCAGLRYPSAPGLPFGLRLAYCSGNWRARAICKKRVTASIPNATLTNNFLLNETATFNSRFVLVALFSLSTILLLLVVLLSLCVARVSSHALSWAVCINALQQLCLLEAAHMTPTWEPMPPARATDQLFLWKPSTQITLEKSRTHFHWI